MTKNQEIGAWSLAGMFLVGVGVGVMWWPLVLVWLGAYCLFIAVSRAMIAVDSEATDFKKQALAKIDKALQEHKGG